MATGSGNVKQSEMYRTFNCGVGMVVIVDADQAEAAIEAFTAQGENAWLLGHIESGSGESDVVIA